MRPYEMILNLPDVGIPGGFWQCEKLGLWHWNCGEVAANIWKTRELRRGRRKHMEKMK